MPTRVPMITHKIQTTLLEGGYLGKVGNVLPTEGSDCDVSWKVLDGEIEI